MAGAPDLFVVCKNCQAEVSPYITECPYCGHRLRKRAPKLDKGGVPPAPRQRRRTTGRGRFARTETRRAAARDAGRPYVTLALVLVPVLVTLAGRALLFDPLEIVLLAGGEGYRAATTLFYYGSTGYELVALSSVFLFGWLLERRHGWWAPLVVFAAGGVGGMALVLAADPDALATGANGAALALLCAWAVRDLVALRRGEEIEADMLGVLVLAAVLVLLPVAVQEAHPLAGAFGAVIGLAVGLPLARLGR